MSERVYDKRSSGNGVTGGGMSSVVFAVGPQVINETIDGETVMIDLVSGNYYVLDPIGAEIWSFIERSASVEDIVCALASRYEAAAPEIEGAVRGLIERLQGENLIIAAGANGNGAGAISNPPNRAQPGARSPFSTPRLEKFTDMQDLILIDPVHQVDQAGWPHVKPADRA